MLYSLDSHTLYTLLVARNPLKISGSSATYLVSRWFALFLSFCFSILYSRLLGLENRSVLTFILTIISLLVLGVTSSLGLRLRQQISIHGNQKGTFVKYLSDLAHLTLVILFLFFPMMLAYSFLVTPINLKILLLATLLLITSNLTYGLSEMLIALDRIRTVGLIGNLEILLQFVVFYFAHYFAGTSLIISVFVGISISYLVSSTIVLTISRRHLNSVGFFTNLRKKVKISELLNRESLAVSLPFVFMDRLDKILIGFMLPLPDLSKYSIVLVFFSVLRSIPETLARIRFSRHSITYSNIRTKIPWGVLVLALIIVGIYPAYNFLITNLLDASWLVSFNTFLVVGGFEMARGFFLLQINFDFASARNSNTFLNILLLILLSILLTIISISSLGLVAVPISFGTAYFILILRQSWINKKQSH